MRNWLMRNRYSIHDKHSTHLTTLNLTVAIFFHQETIFTFHDELSLLLSFTSQKTRTLLCVVYVSNKFLSCT